MLTERLNTQMDLPQDVIKFHKLFDNKGFKLFVVGGAVRDFLMGKKPHDYDMVTDALPETVMEILKGYRTDLQGVHFGIVRVFTEDEPQGYEIASYRKDISKGRDTKGTDKKVDIGRHITIKDDVKRRDLTINSLFYNIGNHEIVDIVGGMADIRNNIIRAVGDPHRRFDEDRLRIIRTIRFAAVTGGDIDDKTAKAIYDDPRLFNISNVDDVSRERIFTEFLKVKEKAKLNNDKFILKRFIDLLIQFGLMRQIFPVLVTERDIKPTIYLTIALAQSLKKNSINDAFKRTLIDAKIPGKYVEIIALLITIYKDGVSPDKVYDLYRSIKSRDLRFDILEEWINVMNIRDKNVKALLYYSPSTNGREVMNDGFKGSEIGEEIARREGEKFIHLVDNLNESIKILRFNSFNEQNEQL